MVGVQRIVEDEEAAAKKAAEDEEAAVQGRKKAGEELKKKKIATLLDLYLAEELTEEEYERRLKALEDGDDEDTEDGEKAKDREVAGRKAETRGAITRRNAGEEVTRAEEKRNTSDGDGADNMRKTRPVVEIRTTLRRKREAEKATEKVQEKEEDEEDPEVQAEKKWGKVEWLAEGDGVSDFKTLSVDC
jgi:hypothetical protein